MSMKMENGDAKGINLQDELVKKVKKNHKISGEELVQKEISGLEKTSKKWMRKLIYN